MSITRTMTMAALVVSVSFSAIAEFGQDSDDMSRLSSQIPMAVELIPKMMQGHGQKMETHMANTEALL